jgi:hypothetical protein
LAFEIGEYKQILSKIFKETLKETQIIQGKMSAKEKEENNL